MTFPFYVLFLILVPIKILEFLQIVIWLNLDCMISFYLTNLEPYSRPRLLQPRHITITNPLLSVFQAVVIPSQHVDQLLELLLLERDDTATVAHVQRLDAALDVVEDS